MTTYEKHLEQITYTQVELEHAENSRMLQALLTEDRYWPPALHELVWSRWELSQIALTMGKQQLDQLVAVL